MPDKKCPRCGLWSTVSALRCDCGYDFEKGSVEESYNKKPLLNTDSGSFRLLLWVINSIFGLLLLAWPIGFFGSMFLFDAPGSTENPILWIAYWSLLSYPVTYFIALISSIGLFRENYFKASIFFAMLPIINIIGIGLLAFW